MTSPQSTESTIDDPFSSLSSRHESSPHNDILTADLSSHLGVTLSLRFDDDGVKSNELRVPPPPSSSLLLPSPSSQCKPQWNDDTIDSPKVCKSQYRVMFEIISAKTVSRNSAPRKKYVSYTILIKRVPGLETHPGVVERRYSDFLALYQSLRKRYAGLLNDFPFPKKTIMGNFSTDIITERSVAFQHLLSYCFSISELRNTPEFPDFLINRELKESHRLMKCAQFEDAANILENAYFIREKLSLHNNSGESNTELFQTLCVLTSCFNAVDNTADAQKYAERAIEMISYCEALNTNELTVPLIILSIRLWWSLGKDKRDLEIKLQQFKQKGINIDRQQTLLELVLRKDFISYK